MKDDDGTFDDVIDFNEIPKRCRAAARVDRKTESTIRLYTAICFELAREPMTAEQVANVLGRSRAAIQPRISELYRDYGLIRPNGGTRRNASSGKPATVWAYKWLPGRIEDMRRHFDEPERPEPTGSFFDD